MRRSGGAFALGAVVLVAAAAFGSRPVGVVGFGLVLAGLVARIWVQRLRDVLSVRASVEPAPATEGDDVRLRIAVEQATRPFFGSARVEGSLGPRGRFECRLRRSRGRLAGSVSLGRLARGWFTVEGAFLELGEPLGLETTRHELPGLPPIVVHPRIVRLTSLFGDVAPTGRGGRRLLLRRPVGFDFHSVREYEQGESLRRVHWPSTARRGQLMVKELEDAPQETAVVLVDCDPAGAVGEAPDSSFDTAVRAAGSVLRLYASRGRPASLATTGRTRPFVTVSSLEGDFPRVLDALAAAKADAVHTLGKELRAPGSPVLRAGELVVVTSALDEGSAHALIGAAARRHTSVVWIDAPSFAGRPTRTSPAMLRLAAAGIPTSVVRRGDDLASRLEARTNARAAHG